MTRDLEFATHACNAGGWKCGQYRDVARWTGHLAQHCTGCGEMFLGERAGDLHVTRGPDGRPICHDPATLMKLNGRPMFEKVPKPTWDPPYAWRRAETNPQAHPEAVRHSRRTGAALPPRGNGSPDLQTGTET